MGANVTWRHPEATERQLSRSIRKAVRDLVVFMRKQTKSMKFDATDDEITTAEEEIANYSNELAAMLIGLLPALAVAAYKFNAKEFVKVANATGGKTNGAVLLLVAVGASQSEPWYNRIYREWLSMTVGSINKLFTNIVNDWSSNIRQANFTNKNTAQVNELSEKRFIVYSYWADNRATGIIGSWNSRLMRQRLEDAGVESYFWHGMLDEREREKHVRWEGKEIGLDEIHPFPSEEYGCRCWAVPNWKRSRKQ